MKYKEITIYTTTQGIDIVSGFLTMRGVRGVVIEDSADFSAFLEDTSIHWDYVEESLMEKKNAETNVKFYLPEDMQGAETFRQIQAELPALREENPAVDLGRLALSTAEVNEEEWSTAWKKYYHTVKIGSRLAVVPCWEEYTPAPGEVKLLLDPGMAFGTGTHETTRLCMCLLEELVTDGCTMLDVGTGSGILAVTALLLGAKSATGVDIDSVAVKTAHENAALNGVDDRLTLYCGDLVEQVEGKFDLLCANIVADVIIRLAADVTRFMHSGSTLLVSGIIEERADEVAAVLSSAGLSIQKRLEENGWVALSCRLA